MLYLCLANDHVIPISFFILNIIFKMYTVVTVFTLYVCTSYVLLQINQPFGRKQNNTPLENAFREYH